MKVNFWKKIQKALISCITLFGVLCIFGCDNPSTIVRKGDTSSLTLNFNGGNIYGDSSIKFSYYQYGPLVGMEIDDALNMLNFGVAKLSRDGYVFVGWTLKKNGNALVKYLPEYGVLYAKWKTTGNQGGGGSGGGGTNNSALSVTFDFNGGTLNGKSSMTFDYNDLKNLMGSSTLTVFPFLSLAHPSKSGYDFVGWTSIKDGDDALTTTVPSSGTHTFYAKWSGNINSNLTITFDFNGGKTSDGKTSITLYEDDLSRFSTGPMAWVFPYLDLEKPTKSGYTFGGWKKADGTEVVRVPSSGTYTYYAIWE